jgi:hypothetical protein
LARATTAASSGRNDVSKDRIAVKVPTKTAEEPAVAVLALIVELTTPSTPSVTKRALPCHASVVPRG